MGTSPPPIRRRKAAALAAVALLGLALRGADSARRAWACERALGYTILIYDPAWDRLAAPPHGASGGYAYLEWRRRRPLRVMADRYWRAARLPFLPLGPEPAPPGE